MAKKNIGKNFLPNYRYIFRNPFFITRRYLYLSISKFAENFEQGKLLDIGCGTKPYQSLFKVDEYVGLDYEKEGANNNESADVLYDGKKFPFKENTFNYALATEVLEHVFEPDFFLKEIRRVVKPGGLCLFTLPFAWDEHEQPYDYARYSSFGVQHLLVKNGFEVVEYQKTGNFVTTLGQLWCTYLYYIFVKNKYAYKFAKLFVFAPITLLTLLLSKMLPVKDGLYLDNVLLVRNVKKK